MAMDRYLVINRHSLPRQLSYIVRPFCTLACHATLLDLETMKR